MKDKGRKYLRGARILYHSEVRTCSKINLTEGILAEEAKEMDKGEQNSLNGKTNCGGLSKIGPYRLIARCGLVTVPWALLEEVVTREQALRSPIFKHAVLIQTTTLGTFCIICNLQKSECYKIAYSGLKRWLNS